MDPPYPIQAYAIVSSAQVSVPPCRPQTPDATIADGPRKEIHPPSLGAAFLVVTSFFYSSFSILCHHGLLKTVIRRKPRILLPARCAHSRRFEYEFWYSSPGSTVASPISAFSARVKSICGSVDLLRRSKQESLCFQNFRMQNNITALKL